MATTILGPQCIHLGGFERRSELTLGVAEKHRERLSCAALG